MIRVGRPATGKFEACPKLDADAVSGGTERQHPLVAKVAVVFQMDAVPQAFLQKDRQDIPQVFRVGDEIVISREGGKRRLFPWSQFDHGQLKRLDPVQCIQKTSEQRGVFRRRIGHEIVS